MSFKRFISLVALAAVTSLGAESAPAQISIPTVTIGNAGNAHDPATGNQFGSVAYTYRIGSTEVTNGEYAAFLNAVAASDTYDLYSTDMSAPNGGINRSGSPGSYTYSPQSMRATHPVRFVTFWDAARFANWLHNGQPTGPQNNTTTEDGAYTLTPSGIIANTITRNAGWQWAVTSENEWYKAAYHQPAAQGGDADNFWLYPTSSNTAPTSSQANINAFSPLRVGVYAANFYGTYDMGGNLWEWNEAIFSDPAGLFRIVRGGSFDSFSIPGPNFLRADTRVANGTESAAPSVGFRVSQSVPVCPGDFNASGAATVQDIFDFLAAYFAADPRADFNSSGGITVQDFFDFLAAYFVGCN